MVEKGTSMSLQWERWKEECRGFLASGGGGEIMVRRNGVDEIGGLVASGGGGEMGRRWDTTEE